MRKLFVPARISLEKYYLPGITKKEGIPLLLTTVPGLTVTMILWFSLEAPLAKLGALFGGFCYCGLCYAVLARIDGSLSIATFVARVIRFYRSQKQYYYKHGKEVLYHVAEENRQG